MNVPSVTTNGRNKYLTILDNAWQDHLKDRLPGAPTVVSLFAGCGGSSLGYSMAGFRELLAVEQDDNAVETFKLNFPEVPVYHGDIAKLSVDQVFEMTGLKEGQLDILDGSPPCQGFSTAGKRVLEDDRNQLFREYVRLLQGLQPRVFVMENVSGMVKGKMKLIFAEIMRELKASGYKVSARLMNAMYFNVPQSRQRMIFVGVRDDLGGVPSFPKVQGRPFTVREAIGHLAIGSQGNHEPQIIAAWKKSKPGQSLRKAVRFVGSFQSVRLDPDKPSNTQIKSHLNWHYAIPRQLSKTEAQLIGSCPENFSFAGVKSNWKERIGNLVPPLFMKAIAEHIKQEILQRAADIGLEPRLIETQEP